MLKVTHRSTAIPPRLLSSSQGWGSETAHILSYPSCSHPAFSGGWGQPPPPTPVSFPFWVPPGHRGPLPFRTTPESTGLPASNNDDAAESASRSYINKKGVATNDGASSFSGGPHKLPHRACTQELLPNYQLGADRRRGAALPPPQPLPRPSCAPAHLRLRPRHLSGYRFLPCRDAARLPLPPSLRFLLPAPASTSSPPEGRPPPPASAGHPCL